MKNNAMYPLLPFLVWLLMAPGYGQSFSLKQCLDYAGANAPTLKIASYDINIANEKVREQIGSVLPQIDATGTLTDNVKISTSLLPGELMGKAGTFVPIKMGTQYNMSGGLRLTQKIFDPTFTVGLKAAKLSEEQSNTNLQKTKETVMYSVCKAYYQTLIVQKKQNSLRATLNASEKNLQALELQKKNGMAKKTDVDKVRVSYNNTKSDLQQTELNYKQALNQLKYAMGMPVDEQILVPDGVDGLDSSFTSGAAETFNPDKRSDLILSKITLEAGKLQKEQSTAKYLPTLDLNANYTYSAMRKKFNFTSSAEDWYSSSAISLNLSIPIFSGFQRAARVEQAIYGIRQAEENLKLTEQSSRVEVSNYEIQFSDALSGIATEKENLDLASSVFDNTQLEYAQGVSSPLDVVQADAAYREAQNNYYNKLLTLYIARLDLEKSKGTLLDFINKSK